MSNVPKYEYPESKDPDVEHFANKKKKKGLNFFKPEVPAAKGQLKKTVIRLLPNPHNNGLEPFTPIFFHYGFEKFGVVCPKYTKNQPCAICDYIKSVYDKTDDIAEARQIDLRDKTTQKLVPEIAALWDSINPYKQKASYYAAVIVRGSEDEGVKYWTTSQTVFDIISDALSNTSKAIDRYRGYDGTVRVKNTGKSYKNKPMPDIDFEFNTDEGSKPIFNLPAEEIDAFIDAIPNPWDNLMVPTFEQTQNYLLNVIGTDRIESTPISTGVKPAENASPAAVAEDYKQSAAQTVDEMFAGFMED